MEEEKLREAEAAEAETVRKLAAAQHTPGLIQKFNLKCKSGDLDLKLKLNFTNDRMRYISAERMQLQPARR